MSFFNKLGYYVIILFTITGRLILSLPKIPDKLRNFNSDKIKDRLDTENLKNNISRIRDNVDIEDKKSVASPSEKEFKTRYGENEEFNSGSVMIRGNFTPEDKERTILILQIMSAAFVVISILSIFGFLNFYLYLPLGAAIIGYIIYLLYKKVKLMYRDDFPAYRDFFLMYIVVGIILVIVNINSYFILAFPFPFLPSATILILALVAVLAVFLIFRIRYYRNFTYGTVLEVGKNLAYVKVEYDIRSNVKPDIYIVENHVDTIEGDLVKLKLEEKMLSLSGNKPVSIMESMHIV